MADRLGERLQYADWKEEKHVPAIECPSEAVFNENQEAGNSPCFSVMQHSRLMGKCKRDKTVGIRC